MNPDDENAEHKFKEVNGLIRSFQTPINVKYDTFGMAELIRRPGRRLR